MTGGAGYAPGRRHRAPGSRHGPVEGRRVGADVEETGDERVTVRVARVKVYGGRLAQGLGLPLAGPGPLRLADVGPLDPGPCRIRDVPVPGPCRAAVAVEGDRPFEVRRGRRSPDPAPC